LLYKGQFGLVKSAESPQNKSQVQIASLISPFKDAYILVNNQLYLASAEKDGAVLVKEKKNIEETVDSLAAVIQKISNVKMPADHSQARRLSAEELSKIQKATDKHHPMVSPQLTNKMFRHAVKKHEEVLGKQREPEFVTGLKKFGTSMVPQSFLKNATKQKLADATVSHGTRFVRTLNTISQQELPAESHSAARRMRP
jgi:predicted GTPase